MENLILAFIIAQLISTAYGLAVIGSVRPIIEKKLKDEGYVLKNKNSMYKEMCFTSFYLLDNKVIT